VVEIGDAIKDVIYLLLEGNPKHHASKNKIKLERPNVYG